MVGLLLTLPFWVTPGHRPGHSFIPSSLLLVARSFLTTAMWVRVDSWDCSLVEIHALSLSCPSHRAPSDSGQPTTVSELPQQLPTPPSPSPWPRGAEFSGLGT